MWVNLAFYIKQSQQGANPLPVHLRGTLLQHVNNHNAILILMCILLQPITTAPYMLMYFINNISHPTKYGVHLSSHEQVTNGTFDAPLTQNQVLIERVIGNTLAHYWCDVIITDCLRSLPANKIFRMGKTMHKLRRCKRTNKADWNVGRDMLDNTFEWKWNCPKV